CKLDDRTTRENSSCPLRTGNEEVTAKVRSSSGRAVERHHSRSGDLWERVEETFSRSKVYTYRFNDISIIGGRVRGGNILPGRREGNDISIIGGRVRGGTILPGRRKLELVTKESVP
ncbi:hypothetical protein SK128_006954, partial [Halocaridina rubra]